MIAEQDKEHRPEQNKGHQPEDDHMETEEDQDHWQQQGDTWIRVHMLPRGVLYDPRLEPSNETEIEGAVERLLFRKTVAINTQTGERTEFREHWRQQEPKNLDVTAEVGGQWTGYTTFFRDVRHCQQDAGAGDEHLGFVAFDEEKPVTLTKGQRRHLQEGGENLKRHDAAVWAQLDPRPALKGRNSQRLLPRGCPNLLLELFAGAAALTAMAATMGLSCGQPQDLLDHQILNPKGRQQVWDYISREDPYLLAVTSLKAPWAWWTAGDVGEGSPQRHRITAERRMWYPVISWLFDLVRDRLQKGREVLLEAPWESLFWQLRCTEAANGALQEATQEPLEVVYCDFCAYGLSDSYTGRSVRRPSGILTSSKFVRQAVSRQCPGNHQHHAGVAQLAPRLPDQLSEVILQAILDELSDFNCAVVFAAEEEAEEYEEFGMIDGVFRENDLGEDLPPPIDHQELGREEQLEEEPPPEGQPAFEQERKKRWLGIDRHKRLAIRRLHHMTGHASTEAMVRMLRSAGTSAEVVAACKHFRCQVCSECQGPKQPSSTTTAPPYRFNHQLICDAFEVVDANGQKHTILSLVDGGTKFHVAGRVAPGGTPSSKVCAEFINNSWLSWAGSPQIFQADQGVHNKGQVASLLRAHGVEIKQAGRQAPWQIGRGERQGGILKAMIKRLITAHQLAGEMAIAAAVTQSAAVKNAMYNHDGYVPSQWVLGRLPHDVTSLLGESEVESLGPHQEAYDPETVYGKNLQIRQWAKECFIYLDSNQRIRRAMLRQSHPMRGPYHTGDLVSYCRRGRWFGPARVLAHEGKSSVWLVHGGMTLLVAETSLRPASTEEIYRKQALTLRPRWTKTPAKRKYEDFLLGEEEDLPFEEETADFDGPHQVLFFDFVQPVASPTVLPTEPEQPTTLPTTSSTGLLRQVTQPEQEPLGEATATATATAPPTESPPTSSTSGGHMEKEGEFQDAIEELPSSMATAPPTESQPTSSTSGVPFVTPLQQALHRSVDRVDGHMRSRSPSRGAHGTDHGQGLTATLGKVANYPEYRNEVHERKLKESQNAANRCLAFVGTRVEKRYRKKAVKQGAGRELNYNKASPELKQGLDASRAKEWANWQKYTNMKTLSQRDFKELKAQDPALKIIPTRWVDVDKAEAGQPERLKSRFVVRGDLEDASGVRTDSPTGSHVAMGILLTYAAATQQTIKSGDISAAFLQGSELDRKLILSMPKGAPPEGMREDDLVMVSTTVYGTKDAPRGWFKKLDTTLHQNHLRRVPLEPGFYVMNGDEGASGNKVKGMLLVHVDDLLWVGDSDMEAAMARVQKEYKFGSLDQTNFKFCGRWLKQGPDGIEVSCPDLIGRVRPIHLEPRRKGQRDSSATDREKSQLRSVVGSLNWLVRVCRPDLAYSVARLQSAVSRPLVQDLIDANNLVKYVARTKDKGLLYPANKLDFQRMAIIAIQDASYAADFDTSASGKKLGFRSQSGRILCLADLDFVNTLEGHLYPVEWHSTIIRRVCRSTLQAESLSLQLGAAEGEHARAVLHGLYEPTGKMDANEWTIAAQDRTPLLWMTDCMSLKEHLVSPTASSVSDKRLAIDLSSLRQELWREEGQLVGDPLFKDFPPEDAKTRLVWTSTDKMLADALTKRITEHGPLMDLMAGMKLSLVPTTDQKTKRGVKIEQVS
eukprot:s2336_g11.t1